MKVETPTFLLIDRNAQARELLGDYITFFWGEDHKILHSSGALEALRIVEQEHVDLIISSLRMTEGSGYDLLRSLQAKPNSPPVIIVSGSVEARRSDLQKKGAFDFLHKTEDVKRLKEIIGRALESGLSH